MVNETRLRGIVLIGLLGLFVALYLLLYHLGFYGALMCGAGSCEVVQTSKYARFLGQPVPLWGTLWYAGVLVLAFLGLGPAYGKRWLELLLALAVTGGLLFSAYLTGVELIILHAVCMWCVISAVLTVLLFVLAQPWRMLRGPRAPADG
ncbi:MAG: vitamin K epoxide reductase family protein [Gemmatimonadales bacterium]